MRSPTFSPLSTHTSFAMGVAKLHRHALHSAVRLQAIDEALLAGVFHRLGRDQGHLLGRQESSTFISMPGRNWPPGLGDDPRLDVLGVAGDPAVEGLQHPEKD